MGYKLTIQLFFGFLAPLWTMHKVSYLLVGVGRGLLGDGGGLFHRGNGTVPATVDTYIELPKAAGNSKCQTHRLAVKVSRKAEVSPAMAPMAVSRRPMRAADSDWKVADVLALWSSTWLQRGREIRGVSESRHSYRIVRLRSHSQSRRWHT